MDTLQCIYDKAYLFFLPYTLEKNCDEKIEDPPHFSRWKNDGPPPPISGGGAFMNGPLLNKY
jgi:hypothetical protein